MDNKSEEKSDDSFLLDSTQQEEDLIIGQPINSNLVTDRNERDMATVNVTPPVQPAYKLYPIRYVMLIALIVLNISNGMMWLTYSPIPQYTAEFYGITTDDVDWFSNSYFIASLVVGFISIAVLDICGLRIAVLCGVVFNLVGSVIRYISTLPFITCSPIFPAAGFTTAIIGQILTAFAQPFFLYAPAKLANTWFGIKERGLCTDLASIANPVGIAVIQLVAPHVVTQTDQLRTLSWVCIIPAGIGAILSMAFLYRSSPLIPPAPSGDVEHVPFFRGVLQTIKNLNFWVLLIVWGLAAGTFNALLILIPQYLCPYGYSDQDVGLWASLMIFGGLIGATVAGILIGLTKWYKEIAIGGFTLAILSILWFIAVAWIENVPVLVATPLCLFGIFGLSSLPVYMELGVEVTYPVAEATSSGLLWSAAQIFGILMVTISQVIATDIDPVTLSNNKCGTSASADSYRNASSMICPELSRNVSGPVVAGATPKDWTNGGILLVVMAVIGYLCLVCLFKPDYKRTRFEQKKNKQLDESTKQDI